MLANTGWMDNLHDADAILVAAHSQGSVVSTHLLDRLLQDGHIRTTRSADASATAKSVSGAGITVVPTVRPQRICCLALCGIHLGPLRYLRTSPMVLPYIQVKKFFIGCRGSDLSKCSSILNLQPLENCLSFM